MYLLENRKQLKHIIIFLPQKFEKRTTYLTNLNKVYILKIKAGILKMKDKNFKKGIRGIKKKRIKSLTM